MKLTALRLHNVRRFADRGVAVEGIGDGVNVLCAANEFGKSTCFDALHALFFLPHTGTSASVQALRPYSGGSPLVEAEIATAEGRFRLTKQFGAGRRAVVHDLASGRLTAQADEAEAFIASLVRGGTAGPAGLLWVRQGITGLERRAKSDEESEKRAREGVLSSVRGEVEAVTGGRRMDEIMLACETELARLVTPTGRPRAGGPFAAAIEERDRLAASEGRLGAEVAALHQALDRRRVVRAQLAEIERPEEEAGRREALAAAEAAFAAARTQAQALKAAEAEAALARDRHGAAAAALGEFRQGLMRFQALGEARASAARQRDEASTRQREAAAAGETAAQAVDAAEGEEAEARTLLARLEKALRARENAERLAGLAETLARAQEARDEVERLEARLRALALPAADIRALEALDGEIVGLRAVVQAKAATLRVAYQAGVTAGVSLDGTPLADGEERVLGGSATLSIEGVGAIALALPRGVEEASSLKEAEARRGALLARLGVAGLAEAREREARAAQAGTALELARQRLGLLAPKGIAALREEGARLAAGRGEVQEVEGDPDAARTRLAAAGERVAQARNAVREAQPQRSQADRALIEAERALAGADSELAALAAVLGPEPQRPQREAALAAAATSTAEALAAAQGQVEALRTAAAEGAQAEARLQRLRSVIEAARSGAARLREEIADLNGQIRARSDEAVEEAWAEVREALRAAQERAGRLGREVATLTRLRDALEQARASARDHYFEPVMRELMPLLGLLFEDASVTFDDETLLPRSVRRNGLEEPVAVLSGGMREQLAVLTRLAFARLLAREGQPAPVILDDALVYSDDDRIERMFDALHRQARDQQIIVFSCRQRAFARLGGNVLGLSPWVPER